VNDEAGGPAPAWQDGFAHLCEILRGACDDAAKQYEDYARTFSGLDSKAQSAATSAGVFLAAVVAFIKPEHVAALGARTGAYAQLVLLLPGLAALATVVLALLAMRVVEVPVPFDAPSQIKEAEDLRRSGVGELRQEDVLDYFRARLAYWTDSLNGLEKTVGRKARWVLGAQVGLAIAVLALLMLLVFVAASLLGAPAPALGQP
jgi:hypothetical protein